MSFQYTTLSSHCKQQTCITSLLVSSVLRYETKETTNLHLDVFFPRVELKCHDRCLCCKHAVIWRRFCTVGGQNRPFFNDKKRRKEGFETIKKQLDNKDRRIFVLTLTQAFSKRIPCKSIPLITVFKRL